MTLGDLCPSIDADTLRLTVDLTVYSKSALLKTCYLFTDRVYVYVTPAENPRVAVYLGRKEPHLDLSHLAGQFVNELLNQELRQLITTETGMVRQLLVAHAFAEGVANQAVPAPISGSPDEYRDDPLRIGL
jgi:His-Xaa-Ser system protein HxsD